MLSTQGRWLGLLRSRFIIFFFNRLSLHLFIEFKNLQYILISLNKSPGRITRRFSYPTIILPTPLVLRSNQSISKACGVNKTRTCDLMGMNHVSYQLLHYAILSKRTRFYALNIHLIAQYITTNQALTIDLHLNILWNIA